MPLDGHRLRNLAAKLKTLAAGFLAPLTGVPSSSPAGGIDAHDLGRTLFVGLLTILATHAAGFGPWGAVLAGTSALVLNALGIAQKGEPAPKLGVGPGGPHVQTAYGTFRLAPYSPHGDHEAPAPESPPAQPAPGSLRVVSPEGPDR